MAYSLTKISDLFKTTFRSLQYKNFRLFWFGQCISLTGTWVQRAAQTWLVYTVTKSPMKVGIVGICQFMPMLLFSLFAGVYVDRFPKKKIIIFTQVMFMLQAIAMTVLTFSEQIQYWHILVLSTIFGLTQTLDMPARQSFFIDLVGPENVTNAISLNSTIVNLARIVGPAVSGIIMMKRGIVFCFFINAISYIPVIIGIYLIKVDSKGKKAIHKDNSKVLNGIQDGISYIRKSETLSVTVIIMAVVCTFAMNNDVIIPVFAKEVLGRGADAYTGLLSMAGLGAFAGAIMMSYISKNGVNKMLLIISCTMTAILQILTITTKLYFLCQLLVLAIGFFNLVFINIANAIFQIYSSYEYRGRVMSVYSFLNQGSTPIGNFFSGALMQNFGGIYGFLSCGATTLVLLVILFTAKRNTLGSWLPNSSMK